MPMTTFYKPAGFCIYCLSTGELTNEHTVPDGMGGQHVIPQASCSDCQDITHRFEADCLRRVFGTTRALLNSYGPRSHRVTSAPITAIDTDGRKTTDSIPIQRYPYHVMLPLYDPPGILTGADRHIGFKDDIVYRHITRLDNDKLFADLFENDLKGYVSAETTGSTPSHHNLCLLLAKIGYVTLLGSLPNTTRRELATHSLIPKLIRGVEGSAGAPFLVGGAFHPNGERYLTLSSFPEQHQTMVGICPPDDGMQLIYARIQLFTHLQGTPVYEVADLIEEHLLTGKHD